MSKKRKKGFQSTARHSEIGTDAHPAQEEVPRPSNGEPAGARSRAVSPHSFAIIASLVIAAVGLIVFASGLSRPFLGDDSTQIVSNVPVHSISNFLLFFRGSTFYSNQGSAPLSGTFYRPIMVTTYSLIYTIFGAHALAFHLLQLALVVLAAILVFLVFCYFFSPPAASLALALVFLVHPIDSQAAYFIPAMQEPLYLAFGMLAFWILLRYRSTRSMVAAAACLLMSMLSKETGLLFVVICLTYLVMFDKARLRKMVILVTLPAIAYLLLKVNAVGLIPVTNVAPIDKVGLATRLLTMPSIIWFYFGAVLLPVKIATSYYWVTKTPSFLGFWLPLGADILVIAAIVAAAKMIRRRYSRDAADIFTFFGLWFGLGLLPTLQLVPLDLTAADTWFYFPMIGMLGMVGTLLSVVKIPKIRTAHVMSAAVIIIVALGARSAIRGFDYRSQIANAYSDANASADNYVAYNYIAFYLAQQGKYSQALSYADRSVQTFPTGNNYDTRGIILIKLGNYNAASSAFLSGIHLQGYPTLYEHIAALYTWYGQPKVASSILSQSLAKFPADPTLWTYLALLDYREHDSAGAQAAIQHAATYGFQNQHIYNSIMNDQPLNVPFPSLE